MKPLIYLSLLISLFTGCQRTVDLSNTINNKSLAEFTNTKSQKVIICHQTGNGSYHAIEVSQNAVSAHLQHGDYLSDADADGFTGINACTGDRTDCDDNNASVHPGAAEVCGDQVDNNCNGKIDEGCCLYPEELRGTWTGYADQVGAGRWTISLTINCDNATVAYPSLGCAGYVNFVSQTGNVFHLREVITSGRCISPCGLSIFVRADGTLSYDVIPSECSGAIAHGTLTKS